LIRRIARDQSSSPGGWQSSTNVQLSVLPRYGIINNRTWNRPNSTVMRSKQLPYQHEGEGELCRVSVSNNNNNHLRQMHGSTGVNSRSSRTTGREATEQDAESCDVTLANQVVMQATLRSTGLFTLQ